MATIPPAQTNYLPTYITTIDKITHTELLMRLKFTGWEKLEHLNQGTIVNLLFSSNRFTERGKVVSITGRGFHDLESL